MRAIRSPPRSTETQSAVIGPALRQTANELTPR